MQSGGSPFQHWHLRRSRNARKQEEFEDTFRAMENLTPIRKPNNEIGSEHGFQSVTESNAE